MHAPTSSIDPMHWAVIVKIDRHGLWRVTYGEDASLPEESVAGPHRGPLPRPPDPDSDPYELDAFAPFRVHERCAQSSVSAACCWRAMPRMCAIRSAGSA